jgi:predicted TIM-barrel fold metal-dependent hydrolase
MILDAQVHIWKAHTPIRPWSTAKAHLEMPFGYPELLAEMKSAGVDGAILIPPGWEGDRIDYALEGAGLHPDRFGVMGRVGVQDASNARLLKGWKSQRGMLGIRASFQKSDSENWLKDGTADWLWPAAEANDIPVMIFAPGQHVRIRAIAESHPRLRLIIDHMGLARQQDRQAAIAIERLCDLADCPNVYVKISSVPLYSTEPYPYRNLHDALRRLIGQFGPQRCFWGTDLTRIKSLGTYRRFVTLFTEELTFLSPDDLDWIMARGLAECLKWPAFV